MRHWERLDPGWNSHLANKSNTEKADFPINDTGWSEEKGQSIPNRSRTDGDMSKNARIDEYVMTTQRCSRKWRTLAKVWQMFLYGGYGSPLSVTILAKWNLGKMANNRQCLNKNSNEMTTGPFWQWWFRRKIEKLMKMANMANNRQIIIKLLLTKYQTHFWT